MIFSLAPRWLLPALLCALPLSVLADHDDHGHRHKHKGGSYKEEFWDGHCKVERKWKRNGEFKEKRKCQAQPMVYHRPPPPVMGYPAAPPGAIVISPQVVIRP